MTEDQVEVIRCVEEITSILSNLPNKEREEVLWHVAHGIHRTRQEILGCLFVLPLVYEWGTEGTWDARNKVTLDACHRLVDGLLKSDSLERLEHIHEKRLFT